MKVINIDSRRKVRIPIGRRGEGNVRQIVFDCTYFSDTYGTGTAQLLHRRRGDEAPYPVLIEQDGNTVTWTVQESDTANVGIGEAELIWMLPDGNAKSTVYETETLYSLSEPGDPPEPWKAWVEAVLKAAESGGATPEQIAEAVREYLKDNPIEIEESDPTVSDWAKQPEKPTYNASEVGALPENTKIPSKTSDLQNDSGYLTEHQDLSDYALKEDLVDKLNKPETAKVGQIFKVKSVKEDGTLVLEAVNIPSSSVDDVQINGTSIVSNKIANVTAQKIRIVRNTMDEVAIADAIYLLGELTELNITLPDDTETGQEITVTWYNGDTPSTLSIAGNMLDFDFTPEANTRSEISALWDGTYWSVIGMSQEVPVEEVVASE